MSLTVRPFELGDRELWADLSHVLFPHTPRAELRAEIEAMAGEGVGRARAWGAFEEGAAIGFAEMGLRAYANGCDARPVPFLEAIWVAPTARRRGVGRALVDHLAAVARAEGHGEIGSDALLDNRASHAAHAAWGFAETQRVVYFRRAL